MKNFRVSCSFGSRSAFDRAVDRLFAADYRSKDMSVLFLKQPGAEAGRAEERRLGAGFGLLNQADTCGYDVLLASGPVASELTATGGGRVSDAFFFLGFSGGEPSRYEERLQGGDIFFSVGCDNEREQESARKILEDEGGEGIAAHGGRAGLASQIILERVDVERRAYEIWENEGRPAGRALDHWSMAERELGLKQ